MAELVTAPRGLYAYAERKFREAIAYIVSRAKYSIYTLSGVEHTYTGMTDTVFSKSFKTEFFKSVGDCIEISIYGSLFVPAAAVGSFQIRITEDSGAIDPVDYLIRVPLQNGENTFDFMGTAKLVLAEGSKLRGHGVTFCQNMTSPQVRNNRYGSSTNYETKNFTISGIAIGDADCELTIDLFQLEFIPAVIF